MTQNSAVRLFPALFIATSLGLPAIAQEAAISAAPPAMSQPGESALPDDVNPATAPPSDMALEVQSISPPAAELIPKIDPLALYGPEIVYDVYRKGSKIGSHRATFTRNGADLTVTSQMELKVDVLFFTAYSFNYDSTEVWRDDKLIAVSAIVDDNGKVAKTSARMEDGLFKVDGPRGAFIGSSWVFPTNHWHRGQAISGTILNTLNGRVNKVDVAHKGIERVETAQGPIEAEHLEYTGQLKDTNVWYDADNRWVKMRFKAKDGSFIEYRCRQCGLTPSAATAVAGDVTPNVEPTPAPEQSANDPVR